MLPTGAWCGELQVLGTAMGARLHADGVAVERLKVEALADVADAQRGQLQHLIRRGSQNRHHQHAGSCEACPRLEEPATSVHQLACMSDQAQPARQIRRAPYSGSPQPPRGRAAPCPPSAAQTPPAAPPLRGPLLPRLVWHAHLQPQHTSCLQLPGRLRCHLSAKDASTPAQRRAERQPGGTSSEKGMSCRGR